MSTKAIECPNCGLVNPSSAMTCDCGFNFFHKTEHQIERIKNINYRKKHKTGFGISSGVLLVGIILTFISLSAVGINYDEFDSLQRNMPQILRGPSVIIIGLFGMVYNLIGIYRKRDKI